MLAYQEPLDRLGEAVRWFSAVPEMLLLHVTVSDELRPAAVTRVLDGQTQPQNRALFLVLETPVEKAETDWSARIEELRENYALARETAAAQKPPLKLPEPKPVAAAAPGLPGFCEVLRSYANLESRQFKGLVVVLAPAAVVDAGRFQSEVRALVQDRTLARVRYVVVEPEPGACAAIVPEFGAFAEHVEVRVAEGAHKRHLARLLAGMKTAPLAAGGQRLSGLAGPKEAPPPRRGLNAPPTEVAAKELGELGAPAVYGSTETMQALRIELMSASLASQTGKIQDAIQHQVRARDVAQAAGLHREAALFELMLGGYLLQGGGTAQQASDVFQRVSKQAHGLGLMDLHAQAEMATASALLSAGRPLEAAERYQKTGQLCEVRAFPRVAAEGTPAEASALLQRDKMLAIECYRMSGQLLLGLGNAGGAQAAFLRALAIAQTSAPAERLLTSAPDAARALSALYRTHGMQAQAEALDRQVQEWTARVKAEGAEALQAKQATPESDSAGGEK